jgi:hypothetical protein
LLRVGALLRVRSEQPFDERSQELGVPAHALEPAIDLAVVDAILVVASIAG